MNPYAPQRSNRVNWLGLTELLPPGALENAYTRRLLRPNPPAAEYLPSR
jgi:hypothetical protein